MPVGIEIYSPSGELILDPTMRITRIVGSIETGTSDGSYTPPFQSGNLFIISSNDAQILGKKTPSAYVVNGVTIVWSFIKGTYAPTPPQSMTIQYGYF